MKFGVLLPSARLFKDESLLGRLAEVGFDGVEVSIGHHFEHRGRLNPPARKKFLKQAADSKIAVSSVCLGWLMDPSNPMYGALVSESKGDEARAVVLESVELCEQLGGTTVLLPFFGSADLRDPSRRARALTNLRRVANRLGNTGVKIGVESTLAGPELAAFLDEVGSPAIGCYWDIGNTMCLGYDPEEEIRAIGKRIVAVHIKEFLPDATWKEGRTSDRDEFRWLNTVPLGAGVVPTTKIARALSAIDYQGWVCLELFPSTLPDVESAIVNALPVMRGAWA